jgi:hypothetical protein
LPFRGSARRRVNLGDPRLRLGLDGRITCDDPHQAFLQFVTFLLQRRAPDAAEVTPLPLRWRIERTIGTQTNRYRRQTWNLEQSPAAEHAVEVANFHRALWKPSYARTTAQYIQTGIQEMEDHSMKNLVLAAFAALSLTAAVVTAANAASTVADDAQATRMQQTGAYSQ